ncbi:MAG: hypothetical protein ABIR57_13015 [Aeromicrobium sp.]
MTATLNITTEITEFARRVRAQLADLPTDDVDDLTDGLEADMAEAFAELPDYELPEPTEYALELRNAAGLPPHDAQTKLGIRQSFRGVAGSIRVKRDGVTATLRSNPITEGALDFLIELRPAWWILRAIVAYMLLVSLLGHGAAMPQDSFQWIVLTAATVVSVQWGRGKWQRSWMKNLFVSGNVLAAIVLVPVMANADNQSLSWSEAESQFGVTGGMVPESMAGIQLNGKDVTNIFAFGSDGKPIKNVQLFDQDGHPLSTSVPGGNGCLEGTPCEQGSGSGAGVWVPTTLETGAKVWNVYPMQMQGAIFDESTGELVADPSAKPEDRKSPFIKVSAVLPSDAKSEKVAQGND